MSEEQLKAFLEKVKLDTSLQEKLKSVTNADAVVEIAKAAGFAISVEEVERAQTEVSDEELEALFVAHGLPDGRRGLVAEVVDHDVELCRQQALAQRHTKQGERSGTHLC